MHLKPAQIVIKAFGGVRATARALGRTTASVSLWNNPKDLKGTDGEIPRALMKDILTKSNDLDLGITEKDLIWGRDLDVQGAE